MRTAGSRGGLLGVVAGWVRRVVAMDSAPALEVRQDGSGDRLTVKWGDAVVFRVTGDGLVTNDLNERSLTLKGGWPLHFTTGAARITSDGGGDIILQPGAGFAVRLTPQAQPTAPSEGQIYYDQALHKLRFHNGAAWETVTSA